MENKFKDAINKMKVIVSEIFTKTEEVDEDLALVAVKAEDGTLLQIPEEGIIVDTEITVINEDGTITPASNGEYVVDGKIIVIVDGKVTEIKEKETEEEVESTEETEPMEEEMASEEFVEENIEDATADADIEEIKAAVNEMVNMMNQIIEFVSVLDKRIADIEKKSEMEKQFSKTIEKRIEELESLPLSESIKKNKNKTHVEETEDKYIQKLRNLRK